MSIASIQSKYPSAIWFDSNHGSAGTGTVSDPYNNFATAVGDITSNDNVIAVKNGSHSLSQSQTGGTGDNSTISLGGTADKLTLVGESTNAIIITSGSGKGGIFNLRRNAGSPYSIHIETIRLTNTSSGDQTGLLMVGGSITIESSEIITIGGGSGFHRGLMACEGVTASVSSINVSNSVLKIAGKGNFGILVGGYYPSNWDAATIVNNTILANSNSTSTRFYGSTGLSPSVFKNNIVIGNLGTETLGHSPATYSNNCFNKTSITSGGTDNLFNTDPQFVDSANGDYRLRPSSPCIGAGTAS